MKFILVWLFLIIIIVGCSSSEISVKENTNNYNVIEKFVNEVKLKPDKNICWINVMPGSTPKFHVSGKITLLPDNDFSENTQLKYIRIFQSGSEIYYIMPKVVEQNENSLRNITYSTIKGLSVSQNLNTEIPVIMELVFVDEKEEFRYRINNVIVEKVQ